MAENTNNSQDAAALVNNAVFALEKRINEITPLAGSNIIIENTGVGIRINSTARGDGGGGTKYNGYFKVIPCDTEAGTVMIVNGANEKSTICGVALAANQTLNCTSTELTVDGEGTVYIRFYYTTLWNYEFGWDTEVPEEDQEIFIPLATTDDDGILAQQWTSGSINFLNGSYVM